MRCLHGTIIHEETDGSLNKLFRLLPVELQKYLDNPEEYLAEIDLQKLGDFGKYKENLEFIKEALDIGDLDTCFSK